MSFFSTDLFDIKDDDYDFVLDFDSQLRIINKSSPQSINNEFDLHNAYSITCNSYLEEHIDRISNQSKQQSHDNFKYSDNHSSSILTNILATDVIIDNNIEEFKCCKRLKCDHNLIYSVENKSYQISDISLLEALKEEEQVIDELTTKVFQDSEKVVKYYINNYFIF